MFFVSLAAMSRFSVSRLSVSRRSGHRRHIHHKSGGDDDNAHDQDHDGGESVKHSIIKFMRIMMILIPVLMLLI